MLFTASVLMVCLAVAGGAAWTENDEESLSVGFELDELDFDELCAKVIPYEWDKATSSALSGFDVLEELAQHQRERAIANLDYRKDEDSLRKGELARKLELTTAPGDLMLSSEKYTQLLAFTSDVSKAINRVRVGCGQSTSINCDLTFGDAGQLLESFRKLAVDTSGSHEFRDRYSGILQLVGEAASANGSPDAESYWLMLSDLEADGYTKARSLWEEVRPLYQNLHRLVVKSLQKKYGPDVFEENDKVNPETRIPAHLLGSRLGHDWTSLAEFVLTKDCKDVYEQLKLSLKENNISGKRLYQKAEKMTGFLQLGKLSPDFWSQSSFDQSCPAQLVDPCRLAPRVSACNTSTWSNYLDAHEITMQSVQSQILASKQLGFLFTSGNRYSAIDTSVTGLAALIASNRHYLSQQEILSLPRNTCVKDALLTLVALRVLPKLPYYLTADLARLEAINTNKTKEIGKIWKRLRYDSSMQGLYTPDDEWWDFLGDSHVAANRPYIGHFYGAFLQFQLFEELLMKDEGTSDETEQFINSRDEFGEMLAQGRSKKWAEIVDGTFHIDQMSSAPLLRFFSRLEKFFVPIPKVPKESRTAPSVVTNPVFSPVTATTSTPPAVTSSTVRAAEASADSISGVEDATADGVSGVTSADQEKGAADTGPGVITFVLIGCGIVIAVGLIALLVNYGRRKFRKTQEYQPPTDQPA